MVTLGCVFHEEILRNLKNDVEGMKRYMKETHNVELEESDCLERMRDSRRRFESERGGGRPLISSSVNAERHLMNEN